jgi:hypothetical protein
MSGGRRDHDAGGGARLLVGAHAQHIQLDVIFAVSTPTAIRAHFRVAPESAEHGRTKP